MRHSLTITVKQRSFLVSDNGKYRDFGHVPIHIFASEVYSEGEKNKYIDDLIVAKIKKINDWYEPYYEIKITSNNYKETIRKFIIALFIANKNISKGYEIIKIN